MILKGFTHCCAENCKRRADVRVTGRIGGSVVYCRRHARRWNDPVYIPQPATAVVLAFRYWDADRPDGGKPRK